MKLSLVKLHLYLLVCVVLLVTGLLSACGSGGSAIATPTTTTLSTSAATATADETALIGQMVFVGPPTAKIVSGTTFEVDGKVKNGDDKQHDIYVKVELLDGSGHVIASATQNVDNVPGGTTDAFAIQGTTTQSTWASVKATVVRVAENVNGAGQD